nr:hypothetical protein [uncultured Ruegeria sp.]
MLAPVLVNARIGYLGNTECCNGSFVGAGAICQIVPESAAQNLGKNVPIGQLIARKPPGFHRFFSDGRVVTNVNVA